jgi:hypothetical protein
MSVAVIVLLVLLVLYCDQHIYCCDSAVSAVSAVLNATCLLLC